MKKTTYIFLHNFRCTGNNLNNMLMVNYPDEWCKIGTSNGEFVRHQELVSNSIKKRPKFILGHNQFGLHKEFDFPCRYFMNFRDPVNRLISGYISWSNNYSDDFYEYYENHEERSNGMTYRLLGYGKRDGHWYNQVQQKWINRPPIIDQELFDQAISNLNNWFDMLIVSEKFVESLVLMERKFKLPRMILPEASFYNATKSFLKPQFFPQHIIDTIKEENTWDSYLHKLALSRLNAELSEQDDDFFEEVRRRKILNEAFRVPKQDIISKKELFQGVEQIVIQLSHFAMLDDLTEIIKMLLGCKTFENQQSQQGIIEYSKRVLPQHLYQELIDDVQPLQRAANL